ncbi:MAG TPA: TlpA disulfide reductase family protein, partial [Candidatus Kapabacteria bacterium]|nr:TlpA disulfide reductase family protein [Candidatus Kapabacteria bacterium]
MKLSKLNLLSLLAAASLGFNTGCAPSTSAPIANSFSNPNAAYKANVSELDQVSPYGTVGSWTGIDIKWKDSAGVVRALSGYSGKVVLLSFWITTPAPGTWVEHALDSVQTDLGDSVRIVTVAEDESYPNNFTGVYNFVTSGKIRSQVIVDSTNFAHIQYAELANGNLGVPETFVLRPNGSIMQYLEAYNSEHILDSAARAAYH